MGDDDAFWRSCGSGGVDDVGGVVGVEREGGCGDGRACDLRSVGIEAEQAGAVGGEPIDQRRMGDQQAGAGIREHEGKALGWILGIERQIGAAGLEDAEQPHHHLERALDAQTHDGLGADPEPAQMMRQLVGARIELRIGEAVLREHHRDRVGGAGDLGGEQLRQARGRERMRGVVPAPQDRVALVRAENVQAADRQVGRSNRRLQQADKPAPEGFDAVALEQVGGVFHHPLDPGRRAVPARAAH